MSNDSGLGTTFTLPSGLSNMLQQQRMDFISEKKQLSTLTPLNKKNVDDEIIAFQPSRSDDEYNKNQTKWNNESDIDSDDNSNASTSTQISLSPPSNLPILIVNLEKMLGYVPTEEDDVDNLKREMREQLLGKKKDVKSDKNDIIDVMNEYGDGISLDFIPKSTALLESDVAIHSVIDNHESKQLYEKINDTEYTYDILKQYAYDTKSTSINEQCIIPYPHYIYVSDKALPLIQIWKEIIQTHKIPIVQHLLTQLQKTSQPLLWKYYMSQEIRSLVKDEQKRKIQKEQSKSLMKWKTDTRPQQLEKLYEVRDTFEQKIESAQDNLDSLERIREKIVQTKMLEYVKMTGDNSEWMDVLNLGQGEFLPSIDSLFLRDDDNSNYYTDHSNDDNISKSDTSTKDYSNHEYDPSNDELYDASDEDNHKFNDTDIPSNLENETLLPKIPSHLHKAARYKKSSKRQKRKLQQQQQIAKIEAREEKIAIAKKEQERLREEFTTSDFKIAQMIVNTLKMKLNQIEDLLESLQEEEWADEEDGIHPSIHQHLEDDETNYQPSKMTLLDQMLAMILGKLPRLANTSLKQHFEMIQSEHTYITKEWKTYFGRLPPISSSSSNEHEDNHKDFLTSQLTNKTNAESDSKHKNNDDNDPVSMRSALGIHENSGDEDWDELDWETMILPTNEQNIANTEKTNEKSEQLQDDHKQQPTPKPRRLGLRPGGRIS